MASSKEFRDEIVEFLKDTLSGTPFEDMATEFFVAPKGSSLFTRTSFMAGIIALRETITEAFGLDNPEHPHHENYKILVDYVISQYCNYECEKRIEMLDENPGINDSLDDAERFVMSNLDDADDYFAVEDSIDQLLKEIMA